ncbi:MAG: hypothetical protein Sw1PiTSA_12640 [Shewanella algae]|uniref:hypothetical protein n=1 Tax=Shewanella algae TaxID=38313 RepID=UPI0012DCA2A1|nr:hypothetical protein [Shewanella algae]MCE9776436.1 hypothetical protein [Shewanella algae]QGS58804.1 hypothetical protein GMX02_04295 [Shewanella algae]
MPDPQSASAQDEPLPQTVTLADLPADIQLVLPIDNAPSAIARLALGVLLLSASILWWLLDDASALQIGNPMVANLLALVGVLLGGASFISGRSAMQQRQQRRQQALEQQLDQRVVISEQEIPEGFDLVFSQLSASRFRVSLEPIN